MQKEQNWTHLRLSAVLAFALVAAAMPAAAIEPLSGPTFNLYTDVTMVTSGLVGSYVNESLYWYTPQDDWRRTQIVVGTRVDLQLDFTETGWGSRAEVGLTGGTDNDWEWFSVQWDGFVEILSPGTQLSTISDDSSRMWIDVNGDDVFDSSYPEFIDNHWGAPPAPTEGERSEPLAPGIYRIRIQYEEQYFGNTMQLVSAVQPAVRFAYVIPQNRSALPEAGERLQYYIALIHDWYREQMDRNGFGPKTFRYEREADGVAPRIHTVFVSESDDYIRQDIWNRTIEAAGNAGVPTWQPNEIWVLVPEIHLQLPDGSIQGAVALGAGVGSGNGAGVAMIGSEKLPLLTPAALNDDTSYPGLTVPEIGPYPLVGFVSFPWFEDLTISSIVSSMVGALAHELTHGFGIAHDPRNDTNFHGNLMYNGLRGFRGNFYPDSYPNDDCRLAFAQAVALSTSQYFEESAPIAELPIASERVDGARSEKSGGSHGVAGGSAQRPSPPHGAEPMLPDSPGYPVSPPWDGFKALSSDATRPQVTIHTSGTVSLDDGEVVIHFTATDDTELSAAILRWKGEAHDELILDGASVTSFFRTPYFDPGVSNNYEIVTYDRSGNAIAVGTTISPPVGGNAGPRPAFRAYRSLAFENENILLDAGLTTDPQAEMLSYEWDLDDDGTFEVGPSTSALHATSFPDPGRRRVRLRVTDSVGAQVASTAIALRILPATGPGTAANLMLGKSMNSPGQLTLMWEQSCLGSADGYAIYEGTLGEFESHVAIDCSDDGIPLIEDVAPGPFDAYYLVVPVGGGVEGSYGLESDGKERPAGHSVCGLPRMLEPCP